MKEIWERSRQSLENMIEACLLMQLEENCIKNKDRMEPMHFLREYGTVKIAGTRRCGMTSAILDLALNKYNNKFVICMRQQDVIDNVIGKLNPSVSISKRFINSRSANSTQSIGNFNPNVIFVDDASYTEEKHLYPIKTIASGLLQKKEQFCLALVQ